MAFLSLRERFWNRFTGKEVDMTPVGTTNTYGVVALMKQCGYERTFADRDPVALTELGYSVHKYAGFEWVKAMGWDITISERSFRLRTRSRSNRHSALYQITSLR